MFVVQTGYDQAKFAMGTYRLYSWLTFTLERQKRHAAITDLGTMALYALALASFLGLPRFFCSSGSVDNNTWMMMMMMMMMMKLYFNWMRKGGENRGRPGTIHHVSDVRWMQGWK